MQNSQTTISDSAGNLLFFTNGAKIYNRNNAIMKNGDSLNYGALWADYFHGGAYGALEDIIGLPTDTAQIWNLVHYYSEYNPYTPPAIYAWRIEETKIDMRGDSGLGTVIFKNKILIQDTIGTYATACQHANGRDWWVLASQSSSNCLNTLLIEPDTVIQYPMQCLGGEYKSQDAGQAAFSPDGTKFAWVGGYSGINIYDFDRCSGILNNPIDLPFYYAGNPIYNYQYGLSFSSDSRFLYIAQSYYILQFDLASVNISGSVDTIGYIANPPDSTEARGYYFLMQLAPDGKRYISANNGIKYLHVINHPDKKGDSCNFVNYGFPLPYYNSFGLPSYPGNYRLGALHGSPCDTLTKADTTGVGIAKITREKILKIYPNPATDYAIIDYGFTDWSRGATQLVIYDAIGQVIYTQTLPMYSGFQKLDVSKFAAGVYEVVIKRSGGVVASGRLVRE